jgi:hypothetical protein
MDDFIMGVTSINEPQSSRTIMLMPLSINEPLDVEMPDPPVVDAITPNACALGDPDFTLVVSGSGFYPASIIVFAGHDEPTTLNEDGTLSTGVKPVLWLDPVVVQCQVRNGPVMSNAVDFTFGEAGTRHAPKAHASHAHTAVVDPDDIEDEIEEAEEEGDFKPTHATRKKRKR